MKEIPKISDFKRTHYCTACNQLYGSDATRTSICPACKSAESVRRVMEGRQAKDPSVMIGVGSGGHQNGVDNHQYDENSVLHKYRLIVKGYTSSHYKEIARRLWGARCVICGSYDCIHVHHINGDKQVNTPSNVVPVCERCHNVIHCQKKMSKEELTSKFRALIVPAVAARLSSFKELENELGVMPDEDILYLGADYIVRNDIDFSRVVSPSRPNAKQETLLTAMSKTKCRCSACGTQEGRLVLTFINGRRLDRTSENLTMLCKPCYNNIIGKYGTYEQFIR